VPAALAHVDFGAYDSYPRIFRSVWKRCLKVCHGASLKESDRTRQSLPPRSERASGLATAERSARGAR